MSSGAASGGAGAAKVTGKVNIEGTANVLNKIKLSGSTAAQMIQIAGHCLVELKKQIEETDSRYAPFF